MPRRFEPRPGNDLTPESWLLASKMWLLIFILFTAVTVGLAWQNGAAEKVRQVILTSVAAGAVWTLVPWGSSTDIWTRLAVIAFAASAGIYWVALKQEERSVEFPALFVYEKDTKKPLESLNDTYAYRFCQRMFSLDPVWTVSRMELAKEDATGVDLYFDVLLRMIVDLLFGVYRTTWGINVIRRSGYAARTISSYRCQRSCYHRGSRLHFGWPQLTCQTDETQTIDSTYSWTPYPGGSRERRQRYDAVPGRVRNR